MTTPIQVIIGRVDQPSIIGCQCRSIESAAPVTTMYTSPRSSTNRASRFVLRV
jgi:hypothetical protein